MPPAVTPSEDESGSDSSSTASEKKIPPRRSLPLLPDQVEMVVEKVSVKDETEDEDGGEEAESGEEDEAQDGAQEEDLYIVEEITDHDGRFPGGEIRYEVKWKGYERKSDRTWEPEENLVGARDILEEYWDTIGGKPEPSSSKKSNKKRSRQSNGAPDTAKKQKRNSTAVSISPDVESSITLENPKGRGRKSKVEVTKQETESGKKQRGRKRSGSAKEESPESDTEKSYGDEPWDQPVAGPGAWEYDVQCVETIECNENGRWAFLLWNARDKDGKNRKTRAELDVVYECCPQRMLKFYENHLVFKSVDIDAQ